MEFLEDDVTWVPSMYVKLEDKDDIRHYLRLKSLLEELDDVQQIYDNIEGADELTEEEE
jgi:transcriptional/translational regulatory protein YebC/TACO1